MKLKKLREKIDRIDKRILMLLNRRAKEVIEVGKLKKSLNYEVFSSEREAVICRRLRGINKGPLSAEDINTVFKEVLSVCRSLRVVLRIAYLGPQGTFTHLAAIKKFGMKPRYLPAESIREVFDKVEKNEVDYGVVPIENSIEGVVNYTVDMFSSSPLKVCAEITLNISHALLGNPGKKIRRIYSNPQVFAQCRKWLSRNLPLAELVPVPSTAKAAISAKKDSAGACIGNKILAGLYRLRVVKASIEDSSQNYTRFLVIAENDSLSSGEDKTSILFATKDRVGALHDALASFKKQKINLTKIESRPSKKKPWEYYFFVDFEGHRNSLPVKRAIEKLQKDCTFIKVLGSYPKES